MGLTPGQIAKKVGAKTGGEILAYENDEDDLLVSVLWGYSNVAGVPLENLWDDGRDLWLAHHVKQRAIMKAVNITRNAKLKKGKDGY